MAHEQRDNTGILFRNDRKDGERDRDYGGSATIAGVEYWISGWVKQGKNGKFMSFSFKPKDEPKAAAKAQDDAECIDSEIPF
jgi:hypothetical protein